MTSISKSNIHQPMNWSILHRNVLQHASTARSRHVACWYLHGYAAATNQSMNILSIWIDSIFSIYFGNLLGVSLIQCINMKMSHFCNGFFQSKITLQQQSVQEDAKWIYFDRFLKERPRRSHKPLIWYNICSVVCLCTLFLRNKRG